MSASENPVTKSLQSEVLPLKMETHSSKLMLVRFCSDDQGNNLSGLYRPWPAMKLLLPEGPPAPMKSLLV